MSNAGLALALENEGIEFRRARVGDRFVHRMLVENDWELGGESSGHILCRDLTSTGDGIISALQVLAEMVETGRPLRDLADGMEKLPQRMINVPVKGPVDLDGSEAPGRGTGRKRPGPGRPNNTASLGNGARGPRDRGGGGLGSGGTGGPVAGGGRNRHGTCRLAYCVRGHLRSRAPAVKLPRRFRPVPR